MAWPPALALQRGLPAAGAACRGEEEAARRGAGGTVRGVAVFTSRQLPVGPPRELASLLTGALQLMKVGERAGSSRVPPGSCERVSTGLCNGGAPRRALLRGWGLTQSAAESELGRDLASRAVRVYAGSVGKSPWRCQRVARSHPAPTEVLELQAGASHSQTRQHAAGQASLSVPGHQHGGLGPRRW